jgi:polyribonucleotide nucleotidyltransferase
MDFKVAGSGLGITALQMDIKIKSVSRATLERALEQARTGRRQILKTMLASVSRPASQVSPFAPRMELVKIPTEKIGYLIGPGGRNIKAMQEAYKVKIGILDEQGNVQVAGVDREKVQACVEAIKGMCETPQIGTRYNGTVKSIKEFGAFVEILPGVEGLVHVSELDVGYVNKVTDIVQVGDKVDVVIIHVDDRGKIKLSRKALLEGAQGGGER